MSFTHVIFPHTLHLCLRPYASAKQGHACLPPANSFPVHVAMSSLHESQSRHLQTLSHAVHPSVAQKDGNMTAPDQEYRGDGGTQSNKIWRLPPGFLTCVRHRRHFQRLLQRRYLSDDRVITHMCAINISVLYHSIFTLLSLFWNEKKKCGHYFLSNPRT